MSKFKMFIHNRTSIILVFSIIILVTIVLSSTRYSNTFPNLQITNVSPTTAEIGTVLKISGKGFGDEKLDSKIFLGNVECKGYDFDYISWDNSTINVKVPTSAMSGYLYLKKSNRLIRGPFISLKSDCSRKYSNKMKVTIDYTMNIKSLSTQCQNPLYIWLPSAVPTDRQRDVALLSKSDNFIETQDNMLDLFKIQPFEYSKNYTISKKFSYNSYQLNTKILPNSVPFDYDFDGEFYKYYTASDYAINSDDTAMHRLADSIVKDEQNPYLKARLIYDFVVNFMSYQYPPPNRDWRAISALRTHRGDCAVYSFLFTSLCRAVGVPARPVAGHVIFINNAVSMHFWAEFFIPRYGWIPVDANYGDYQVAGFLPKEQYFGNLDNRHIAFSKGRVEMSVTDENQVKKSFTIGILQKYHSYMKNRPKGKIFSVSRKIDRVDN